MELYFWLHRLSLHRRSCFGVKVLFEMTVKYGPPWLQFKVRIGKQKLIRQCHSADSAAFAAWLVWFLPSISCLTQAANPGRRFSRPGVTIAAWRFAAWIRTLTKHAIDYGHVRSTKLASWSMRGGRRTCIGCRSLWHRHKTPQHVTCTRYVEPEKVVRCPDQ